MPYSYTIQAGTTGIQFVVTVIDEFTNNVKNISTASSLQIIFTKPDHTSYAVNASLYTDGTDGKMSYISTSSDLTVAGIWYLQGSYIIGTNQRYTNVGNFTVLNNLTQYNP